MFPSGHFVPKFLAQFPYSNIMGVAKWGRDLWWLSLFCESVDDFDHFLIERPPVKFWWTVHYSFRAVKLIGWYLLTLEGILHTHPLPCLLTLQSHVWALSSLGWGLGTPKIHLAKEFLVTWHPFISWQLSSYPTQFPTNHKPAYM